MDKQQDEEPEDDEEPTIRRSARGTIPVSERLNITSTMGQSYSGIQVENKMIQYNSKLAIIIAMIICTLNEHQVNRQVKVGMQNVVTYMLNKAIMKFGQNVSDAALKEMKQLLDCKCFVLIHVHTLTQDKWKHMMESLLFLVKKCDGSLKARHCANGSIQWNWITGYPVKTWQA